MGVSLFLKLLACLVAWPYLASFVTFIALLSVITLLRFNLICVRVHCALHSYSNQAVPGLSSSKSKTAIKKQSQGRTVKSLPLLLIHRMLYHYLLNNIGTSI